MGEERWVFVMKVQDAPGALTAIATVFSSRGVSLETILGNGVAVGEDGGGRIVLSFRATEKKKETLMRTVARLARVVEVQDYPFAAPELRAIAIARLCAPGMDLRAIPAHAETLSEGAEGTTILLSGDAKRVDEAINALRAQEVLLDAVVSVMAV
jgi:acetolactate synthase small subunit